MSSSILKRCALSAASFLSSVGEGTHGRIRPMGSGDFRITRPEFRAPRAIKCGLRLPPCAMNHEAPQKLELLAPAKTGEFGIEAINHGADAVYIGGPAFGARANAGNEIGEIAALAGHAHRYNARVLVALNTILHDNELEEARRESPGRCITPVPMR